MIQRICLWCIVPIVIAAGLVVAGTGAAHSLGGSVSHTLRGEWGGAAPRPAIPRHDDGVLGCGLGWHIVPSPNGGAGDNVLYDVAQAAPDRIWAVGSSGNQTLVELWDGNLWRIVPSPNPGSTSNLLYSVAVTTPSDTWAVGTSRSGGNNQTLVEHWDGTNWTVVPSPNFGTFGSVLRRVAVRAANDVWAAGYYYNGTYQQPLIGHWDGTQWSVAPGPSNGPGNEFLIGVVALAANDAWIVGDVNPPGGGATQTTIERWNGTQWTLVPNSGAGSLLSVAANTATDIWSVGFVGSFGTYQTLTKHWNGTAWSTVPSPNGGSGNNSLNGVTTRAANDVWAVGDVGSSFLPPISEHWDGGQWSLVPVPGSGSLQAVTPGGLNDLWAVGYTGTAGNYQTLIERYNPPCLTPSPTPPATATASAINSPTAPATAPPSATRTPSITPTPTVCPIQFTDVPPTNPFYPYVRCLACRGIISGYTCGGPGEPCDPQQNPYFRPYANITRGQAAKVIANSAGYTDALPSTRQSFADVPASQPFWLWIERVAIRGIISGYDCGGPGEPCDPLSRPYYRPANNLSRGQLAKIATIASNIIDPIPPTQQTFTDVPPNFVFWQWIERLAGRGYISGYTCGGPGEPCDPQQRPYFRPYNEVTRGQASKIIANTFFPGCQTPVR